jgi:hypothetical protein
MITKLYNEIKKIAGNKFVVGKIYKFECYLFPPGISHENPQSFNSSIVEITPAFAGMGNLPSLEEIGEKIPLEFKEEHNDLSKLLIDDISKIKVM